MKWSFWTRSVVLWANSTHKTDIAQWRNAKIHRENRIFQYFGLRWSLWTLSVVLYANYIQITNIAPGKNTKIHKGPLLSNVLVWGGPHGPCRVSVNKFLLITMALRKYKTAKSIRGPLFRNALIWGGRSWHCVFWHCVFWPKELYHFLSETNTW